MGAEGKRYLQEHSIPQLFEGLMTGLIYNKPPDPLNFLENAIAKIRSNPELALKWDTFIDAELSNENNLAGGGKKSPTKKSKKDVKAADQPPPSKKEAPNPAKPNSAKGLPRTPAPEKEMPGVNHTRVPSVTKAAEVAKIPPDVPIILFIGGPGGGKTRIAAKVRDVMENQGLVHICMPDLVKTAVGKYKDRFPEWKEAAEKYDKGELIPNHLAEDIVKAEMGRHPEAKAYFLEGFPREARQIEDFERNVRPINMALILDYDEDTLRKHMQGRGLATDVMDRRISEFKQKTLPSAKYFDDQRLLHLIPGEKEDSVILERMKKLITRAIELGVPIYNSATPESAANEHMSPFPETPAPAPVPIPVVTKPVTSHSRTSAGSNGSAQNNHSTPTPPQSAQAPPPSSIPPTPPPEPIIQKTAVPVVTSTKPPTPIKNDSKPTTATTRPPTTNNNQKENSSPPTIHTPPVENGPATPKPATPKPATPPKNAINGVEPARIATADVNADKFPKGLPNNSPVILVIGGPGSNKSEIAKKIAGKYDGFALLSMGDLLRKKVLENVDDELWQRIGKKMDAGEMIPLQICRELLYTFLHEHGTGSWGYVLEGYPRTQKQVEDLEQQLGRLDVALLIDCTEHYCRDNLTRRYKEGLEHGSERKDDAEEVVKTRLGLFKQNTLPMLKYLDDKGKLRVIDGDATNIENIFKDVTNAIDNTVFIQENDAGKSLASSKNNSVDEMK